MSTYGTGTYGSGTYGDPGAGSSDPSPPTVPARVTSEPVDDALFVEVRFADGDTAQLSGLEADATNIPTGLAFSNSAPGGHRDGRFALARNPRRDWPDLNLVDEVVFRGRTMPLDRNAFEGSLGQISGELGGSQSISATAVGNQEMLNEDESWSALYVALGFEGWQDAPLWRRQEIASGGFGQGKIQASAGDGLSWEVPREALALNEHAELWWEAPAGIKVNQFGYRGQRTGDWSNLEAPKLHAVDSDTTAVGLDYTSASLTLDNTPRVATLSERRRLWLRALTTAPVTPAEATQQTFDRIALYGTDVPLREIPGELPGVYAHDVLPHMLDTAAPDLRYSVGARGTIVPNTSFAIPDLAFLERGPVRPAIEKLNASFLNNWAVWDERQFWWHPWDPDRLTWDVSIAGGAHWAPVGREAAGELNGLIVQFTDGYGYPRNAGPPGSGCDYEDIALLNLDPHNPYTRRGRRRWGVLRVEFPIAYPFWAFQIGSVVLAESRMPARSGTLVIRPLGSGHIPQIQHPTMGPLPVWALRSGDYVQLNDWPEPEPFRVIEVSYDGGTKTLTAQLDSASSRVSAIIERGGLALVGIVG